MANWIDNNKADLAKIEARMRTEDMVDAALVGLDQGELVALPSLHAGGEWTRFEAARCAMSEHFFHSEPAPRYRIGEAAAV